MSNHYMCRVGDPTTTGGVILNGSHLLSVDKKPVAYEGVIASCPACKAGRGIVVPKTKRDCVVEGKTVLKDGDTVLCGCPFGSNTIIATQFEHPLYDTGASFAYDLAEKNARAINYQRNSAVGNSHNQNSKQSVSDFGYMTEQDEEREFKVGYIINDKTTTLDELFNIHVSDKTYFKLESMFKKHNEHLQTKVLAGEVIIFANEPKTDEDKSSLSKLQEQARIASQGVQQLTEEEAKLAYETLPFLDHVAEHQDKVGHTTAGIGVLSASIGQRLNSLNNVLEAMDRNYLTNVENIGGRARFTPAFYQNRLQLISQLDNALERLTLSKLNIGDSPNIKHTLGLSSKSILHNWDTVSANGSVPELGKHINRVAMIAKGASTLGWIGIGIDAGVSATNITKACVGEDTSQCERVSYKETGGLTVSALGGLGGGYAGAKVGTAIGGGIVLVLGIASGGIVIAIAAVAGAGTGAYFGSSAGKDLGQNFGEIIYNSKKDF